MITKIQVKGFKSLKDASIEFYTSKNIADKNKHVTNKHQLKVNSFKYTFNLAGIVGANATGKSSFLEAVYFYKKIVTNQFQLTKSELEAVCGLEKKNKEFTFEYLIDNEILIHNLKLDGDFKILSESLLILKSNVEEEKWESIFNHQKNYSLLWRIAEISQYENLNSNIFNFSSEYSKFINKIFNEICAIWVFSNKIGLNDFNDYLYTWKRLLKVSFKNKVSENDQEKLDLLKSIVIAVDPNVIEFGYDKIRNDIFVIVSDNNKKVKVPFESISDGTKRFISLVLPIFIRKNSANFYLIDEIENSFHPKLVDTILRLFYFNENNSNHSQLLFITHNPYIFDLVEIHNSCINIGLYNDARNFEKLSNFNNYKRNDKLFSKNYMLEVINSHPDSNNLSEIYDCFTDSNKRYERI